MAIPDEHQSEWMRCSFVPTIEDGAVFLRYHATHSVQVQDTVRRSRKLGVLQAAPFVLVMVGMAIFALTPWGQAVQPFINYGLPVLMVSACLFLVGYVLRNGVGLGPQSVIRRTFEEQARTGAIELDLRPMTVCIGPDGVHVDRGTATAWNAWQVIQRIVEAEERLLLYYLREQAIVIPRRAFDSRSEADRFVELVEANLRRDPGDPASPPTLPARQ